MSVENNYGSSYVQFLQNRYGSALIDGFIKFSVSASERFSPYAALTIRTRSLQPLSSEKQPPHIEILTILVTAKNAR